jgi:hypothetical protein
MRKVVVEVVVAAALAGIALLAVGSALSGPVPWVPDGLFYQARVYEIRDGDTQPQAALRAFGGPLGAHLRAIDPTRSGSPRWVAYNAKFYERRLAVPLVASALEPVAGDRAILDVSIAGYVAAVLAVFWLLLVLRLPLPVAAAVALATALLPALKTHSSFPLTDSWGLALETAAFATAVLTLRRGPRWLIAWAAAIGLLSITRDSMWIPVLAAIGVALIHRSRVTAALAATGVAAALPAVLAIQVPMRELLAQMVNGLQPAPDLSWTTIAGRYPGAIVELLKADGGFVRNGAWYSALFLLAGLALLFALGRGRRGGDTATLLKAGALAGAAYVLVVPVFSAFRLELVLIPMAALGLGLAAQYALVRLGVSAWGVSEAVRTPADPLAQLPPSRKSGPAPQPVFGDLTSSS